MFTLSVEDIFISSLQTDVWTEPDGELLYEDFQEKAKGVLNPSGFLANREYFRKDDIIH